MKLKGFRVMNVSQTLWLGEESLINKTLLVESEQGIGDVIQFCRYIPLLANSNTKIIMETPKTLYSIIKTLGPNVKIIEQGKELPHFDYHIPIMSLPLAFKTSLNDIPKNIPYLFVDDQKRKIWKEELGEQKKIRLGLAWSGSKIHKKDKNRSLLLRELSCIFQLPLELHSLQKEIREIDKLTLVEFNQIYQHQEKLDDFSDTAALIEKMDLIISVDTSIAHLAGALGKPIWILLPFNPDFRWMLNVKNSPWYPSARLFRQPKIGDWESVINEVFTELTKLISSDG